MSTNEVELVKREGKIGTNYPELPEEMKGEPKEEEEQTCKLNKVADLEKAIKHGVRSIQSAQLVYKLRHTDLSKETEKCDCCQLPIVGEKFPICVDTYELGELGTGFPLYFYLLKFFLLIFIVVFVIAGAACLIMNIAADRADEWEDQGILIELTPGNYGNPYLRRRRDDDEKNVPLAQVVLHFICLLFLMIFFPYIKKRIHEKNSEIDIDNITPADFTVWIKNLPAEYTEEELKNHLEALSSEFGSFQILSVVKTYNIQEHAKIAKELLKWKSRKTLIKQLMKENEDLSYTVCCCCKKPYPTLESMRVIVNDLKKQQQELTVVLDQEHMLPIAFVTFKTQVELREIEEIWNRSTTQRLWDRLLGACGKENWRFFKGKYIRISRAPEPSDVYWENLGVSLKKRLTRQAVISVITSAVLVLAFFILFLLKSEDEGANMYISVLISLVITMINFILGRLVRILASYESHHTRTAYNISVAEKLVIAFTINTCLLPLLINLDSEDDWFTEGGLITDIFWVFMVNAFGIPTLHFINVMRTYKVLRRFMLEHTTNIRMNQATANFLYEGPDIDLANFYAHMIKTIMLALAYAPLMPIGLLYAFIGLVYEYAVVKYMLLRVYKRPLRVNERLTFEIVRKIEWCIVAYGTGIYIFLTYDDQNTSLGLAGLILTIIYLITPINTIFKICFKDRTTEILQDLLSKDPKSNSYEAQLPFFHTDYERENPVLAAEAWNRWKEYVETNDSEGKAAILSKNLASNPNNLLLNFNKNLNDYAARRKPMVKRDEFDLIGFNTNLQQQTSYVNLDYASTLLMYQQRNEGNYLSNISKLTASNPSWNIGNARQLLQGPSRWQQAYNPMQYHNYDPHGRNVMPSVQPPYQPHGHVHPPSYIPHGQVPPSYPPQGQVPPSYPPQGQVSSNYPPQGQVSSPNYPPQGQVPPSYPPQGQVPPPNYPPSYAQGQVPPPSYHQHGQVPPSYPPQGQVPPSYPSYPPQGQVPPPNYPPGYAQGQVPPPSYPQQGQAPPNYPQGHAPPPSYPHQANYPSQQYPPY